MKKHKFLFDFPENGEIKPTKVRTVPLVSSLNTCSHHADYPPPMNCQYEKVMQRHVFCDCQGKT